MVQSSWRSLCEGDSLSVFMQSVNFIKKFDWTTLQVKFRGTLRAGYGYMTNTWAYWRILFNGGDCSNPGHIESIHYNFESDTDHHKASGSKW